LYPPIYQTFISDYTVFFQAGFSGNLADHLVLMGYVMRVNTPFILMLLTFFAGCGGDSRVAEAPHTPDPVHGQQLFQLTCSQCHGGNAQGLPRSGANLRKSQFVAEHDDNGLLTFVKRGRMPKDPDNRSGVFMPPRGGNNQLDDPALLDIVAHLRHVQQEAKLDPPDDDTETAGADSLQ
jgi:mono/diheme cytochrome c family protein